MTDLDQINQKLDLIIALLQNKKPVKVQPQTDEAWLTDLKQNKAYAHINFEIELGKMQAWLDLPQNKGRKLTRAFILNWLGKIPVPVQIKAQVQNAPPAYVKDPKPIPKGEACPPEVAAKLSRLYGKDFSFTGGRS